MTFNNNKKKKTLQIKTKKFTYTIKMIFQIPRYIFKNLNFEYSLVLSKISAHMQKLYIANEHRAFLIEYL